MYCTCARPVGREGGRERGREGGREGERERGREGGREGGRERARDRRREIYMLMRITIYAFDLELVLRNIIILEKHFCSYTVAGHNNYYAD